MLAAFLTLVFATLALLAPVSAAAAADRAESYTFSFHDAQISQVAEEILGATLGVSYTIDPTVTATMSFRIDQRLTRAQLLDAFEAALTANDIALVREGDSIILTPRSKAKSSADVRMAGQGGRRGGYEVVAVPLSFAAPSEVAKAFEAIGPANSVVYTNDKLGLLLIGGAGPELETTLQTISLLDRSGLEGAKIRWFELTNASASTIAGELGRVLAVSGVSGVSIVPLRRLNGIFVFAHTPQALDEVGGWIAKLDVPAKAEAQSLWVYRPVHVSAEALGKTLNGVVSGQDAGSSVPATQGAVSPDAGGTGAQATSFAGNADDPVRIGVDTDSNTLLVAAPAARWIQIQRMLMEIDRPPTQVLIEASILEVTLSNEFRLGVDWSVLGSGGDLNVTSTNDKTGGVGPTFPGFAITFINDDIRAAINALGSRTAVEVVSAPKIVTLVNRTAKLQVGDQVPVAVSSARSSDNADAPLVVQTEYRNTGVILNVTPRISGADGVILEISQEVSSVARTTTSGIDSPTIQQRRMDSTLLLQNGGVVALGGLISSTKDNGASGVPGLKDVPGLGALFRSGSNNQRRTELIVLLTARIMRDPGVSERITTDLLADLQEVQRRGLLAH